jgi:hypothetical protein
MDVCACSPRNTRQELCAIQLHLVSFSIFLFTSGATLCGDQMLRIISMAILNGHLHRPPVPHLVDLATGNPNI